MRGIHSTKIWEKSKEVFPYTKQPAVWSTPHVASFPSFSNPARYECAYPGLGSCWALRTWSHQKIVPNKCVSNFESTSRQVSFVKSRITLHHWIRREILHQLGTLTFFIALDMDSGEVCVDRTMVNTCLRCNFLAPVCVQYFILSPTSARCGPVFSAISRFRNQP